MLSVGFEITTGCTSRELNPDSYLGEVVSYH